jgi:hypothetical protein
MLHRQSILGTSVAFLIGLAVTSSALAQSTPIEPDFALFRNEVQPIFLAKRGDNVRCIQRHTRSSNFRLQPLDEHAFFWTEEQSRMNYAPVRASSVPGADPLDSRFLTHLLDARPLSRRRQALRQS